MRFLALLLTLSLAKTAAAQTVADHLECYKVKDPSERRSYTATLGGLTVEQGCVIKVPALLVCVPATKTDVVPVPPGGSTGQRPGSFGCYRVRCPRATEPPVPLNDQFGARVVAPTLAKLLCAPTTCAMATDCPNGTACNTTSGACEITCGDASHTACNGGCCAAGTCASGMASDACGVDGGACLDCAGNANGNACVGGRCGCLSPGDCPAATPSAGGQACLLAGTFVCVSSCNQPNLTPCHGGCCSGSTCVSGTMPSECGSDGNTCDDCVATCGPGPACVVGACGCTSSMECGLAGACGARDTCTGGACQ